MHFETFWKNIYFDRNYWTNFQILQNVFILALVQCWLLPSDPIFALPLLGWADPCRLFPRFMCQLASGFGQCENRRRLGVAGGRAHAGQLSAVNAVFSMAACAPWLRSPGQLHWGASYCPVTLALGSGNPAASLWLSLPLLISGLPCSLVWLSTLLSPLCLIPCIDFPLLRNDKVVSLLDPDCSL